MITLPKRLLLALIGLPLYLVAWFAFCTIFAIASLLATIQLVWRGR